MKRAEVISIQNIEPGENTHLLECYEQLLQIWILRIVIDINVHRSIQLNMEEKGIIKLLDYLNIEIEPAEDAKDAFSPIPLARRLRELEAKHDNVEGVINQNLKLIKTILRLNEAEVAVLEFCILFNVSEDLKQVLSLIGENITMGELIQSISIILQMQPKGVERALHRQSILTQSGFVHVIKGLSTIPQKVVVDMTMLEAVTVRNLDQSAILSHFISTSSASPSVELARAYPTEYDLVRSYVSSRINSNRPGCNILIFGPPGVGKNEFAQTVVSELGLTLYQVPSQDESRAPIIGSERVEMLHTGLLLLSNTPKSIYLVQHAEELIYHSKSFINQSLKDVTIPVIWITDDASEIDTSLINHFDLVIEMQPMSMQSRSGFIKKSCADAGIHTGSWIDQAASSQHLSPKLITNATQVLSTIKSKKADDEIKAFETVTNSSLSAMGHTTKSISNKKVLLPYALDLVNTDTDLARLTSGLSNTMEGRILCYGPPGTGKTEYVKHLAEEMNVRLCQFCASDILSPFIGRTEINIARAFIQSKNEGGILLLDEIDSLLRDRGGARESWEISQVNELLVQMENYTGLLIACTNHLELLDDAASRRFDVKVRFDFLDMDQAWSYFQSIMNHYNQPAINDSTSIKKQLATLEYMTPGDFTTALRQMTLIGDSVTSAGLIEALKVTLNTKTRKAHRGIGFSATI